MIPFSKQAGKRAVFTPLSFLRFRGKSSPQARIVLWHDILKDNSLGY